MKRGISILLCFILALCLFSGCGASSAVSDMAAESPAAPAEPMAPMPEAEEAYDYGYYEAPQSPASATDIKSSSTNGSSLPKNTKLIYTADMELETTAFDDAIAGLEKLVKDLGAYFESSNVNNYGSYRRGSYTVRVPAGNFDSFCTAVGQLCQLNSISRSARDVSEAYYDTESRLVTQQTKLDRLQGLLAQASTMEDIIELENAISDTEYQIEQLTGTLRKYDSLVGYSTVSISIDEVFELTEVEEPVIGFGAKLAEAFKRGSSNFVDSLQRMALRFARNWVGWLIWIVIIAVAVFIVLRSLRRRKARYAPKVDTSPKDGEKKD